MKDHTSSSIESRLHDRLKGIRVADETPPDRELRRLRGLSTEVGAACTVWLTSRGIKSRSWGAFELKPRKANGSKLELQTDRLP